MAMLALADQAKRSVCVDRLKLLATLRSNKEKHIQAFNEAMDGYKQQATEALEKAVSSARAKLERNYESAKQKIAAFDPVDKSTAIDRLTLVSGEVLNLPLPVCYDKAYDSAIVSTEWDNRDSLELTHAQFECFVRDIWDWSDEFATVSSMYSNKKAF